MKSLKNRMLIVTLAALPLMYSASAMATGPVLSGWRTAAVGNVVGAGQFLDTDQMFVGNSSSSTICGSTPAPCDVVITLKSRTVISTTPTASFTGTLSVVKPSPLFGTHLLSDTEQARYPLIGSLSINLSTGTGTGTTTVMTGGGSNLTFSAKLSINGMFIYDPVTGLVLNGGVIRIDLTPS